MPWSTSVATYTTGQDSTYNYYGYGPSTNHGDDGMFGMLTGSNAMYDWGYNPISNGGSLGGQWRTLTREEWVYLFTQRSASTVGGTSNTRFAKATLVEVPGVNRVQGVILFPDEYVHPSGGLTLNAINNPTASFGSNEINVAMFDAMRANGAVFLPAAGYRNGPTVYYPGSHGRYWTVSPDRSTQACAASFTDGNINPGDNNFRCRGFSVRLVCPAEN